VTIGVRRYNGGATRNSTVRPRRARRGGSVICHIVSCTWCSHTTRGRRAHTGEKNGMPFQISISPSLAPCQPIISLNAARGNTMYRPALRITR
jgi:hypothetical protein